MKNVREAVLTLFVALIPVGLSAQTNPLWTEQKVRNYLPHMTPFARGPFFDPTLNLTAGSCS